METRTTFNRVTGDEAYSIWFGYNEGDSTSVDKLSVSSFFSNSYSYIFVNQDIK